MYRDRRAARDRAAKDRAASDGTARDTTELTANRRARLAIFWIFALCGVVCSLWSTSLPTLNTRLHLGATRLGFVLLLLGAGAMATMPVTGRLCDRLGSRTVLRVGGPVCALPLIGPALAPSFGALLALAFLLGAGIGSLDVAMNAHAIVVEKRYGRPIMSAFHGFWSVGGVLGSGVFAIGLHLGASPSVLMIAGACASAALLIVPGPLLLPGSDRSPLPAGATPADAVQVGTTATGTVPAGTVPAGTVPADATADGAGPVGAVPVGTAAAGAVPVGAAPAGTAPVSAVPAGVGTPTGGNGVVLLLGVVAAAGFICEAAAYNWAPLHAIRELHVSTATAALAYTIFAVCLTAGRLTGDGLRRWLGPVRAIAWAGTVAALGYTLVFLAPSLPFGRLQFDYAGWAIIAIGLATVIPSIFSTVGERDGGVGRALSLVAVCAYSGELAGPAVIGPVAGATSLRIAMLVPTGLAIVVATLGPVAIGRALRPARAVTIRPDPAPAENPARPAPAPAEDPACPG